MWAGVWLSCRVRGAQSSGAWGASCRGEGGCVFSWEILRVLLKSLKRGPGTEVQGHWRQEGDTARTESVALGVQMQECPVEARRRGVVPGEHLLSGRTLFWTLDYLTASCQPDPEGVFPSTLRVSPTEARLQRSGAGARSRVGGLAAQAAVAPQPHLRRWGPGS